MPPGKVKSLESFLINYTPNTALGKKHVKGRRPGYSREKERAAERELVRERKQLKGQEEIEKALFDYTIYPAALFRKDATLKAARARDAVLFSSLKSKSDPNSKKNKETIFVKTGILGLEIGQGENLQQIALNAGQTYHVRFRMVRS